MAPLEVGGWGAQGEPEGYDPGAPTGPFQVVTGSGPPAQAAGGGPGYYDRLDVPRAELVARVSSGEGTELPHWADPPTGEVPRALVGRQDDEMQAWRLLGSRGLHWREDAHDWSGGPGVEDLLSDQGPVGVTEQERSPFSFDDDFERLEQARVRRTAPPPRSEGGADAVRDVHDEGTDVTELDDGTAHGAPPRHGPRRAGTAGEAGAEEAARPVTTVRLRRNGPPPGARLPVGQGARPRRRRSEPGQGPDQGARGPYDVAEERGLQGHGGRDVGAAVTTGLALAVLLVFCYLVGPGAILVLAVVGVAGSALEAFSMFQRAGFRPATLVGGLGAAAAVVAAYWRGPQAVMVVGALVVMATLTWYLVRVVEARAVVNSAVTLFGFVWVGGLGSFAGVLLAQHHGAGIFFGAVVPTVVADMVAWFAGSRFGSHPLAPTVSPGKTWEGFLAGAVAALVAGAVVGKFVVPWGGASRGLVLGLVVAIAAPLGDLAQSMVKRDLRLKDSGALLPGHGGLLDRFDSLLFVLPATYFLVTVLHIA